MNTIKFYIDGSWLREERDEKLLPAFRGLIIVRAEYRWDFQGMEYVARNFLDDQVGDVDIMVKMSPMCRIVDSKIVPKVEFRDFDPNDPWRCLRYSY